VRAVSATTIAILRRERGRVALVSRETRAWAGVSSGGTAW